MIDHNFYLHSDGSLCRWGEDGLRCWVATRGWAVNMSSKCDLSPYGVHWGAVDGTRGCGCTPRRLASSYNSHRGVMSALANRLLRRIARLPIGNYRAAISLDEPQLATVKALVCRLVQERERWRGCDPHHNSNRFRDDVCLGPPELEPDVAPRMALAVTGKLMLLAPAQVETLRCLDKSARDLAGLKWDARPLERSAERCAAAFEREEKMKKRAKRATKASKQDHQTA